VMLVIAILVVGALPRDIQEKVPLLPTIARPISATLPSRIQQRFHLWLDGFDPPSPEVSWWKKDYQDALNKDPTLKELAEQSPAMQKTVNVDIWFDKLAFQPAQATFGIDSGGTDSASSGFARIHFEACWFEGTFHEGNSLSGFKDVSSFQTVYLNCGQGIEDGYNAPTGRVVRGLFLNCQSGARHGDNYEDIGNYDGRLTVTDSILLDNHRDLLVYNWRLNGWTNAWGQFFATNNLLTALDTNFPNNQVFQPASDAWRLSAFQAAGRVGAAMTLWPGHAALTNLPDGVPVGLSRFSSNVVTVNYRVDGTDVAAVSDTLVFTPGLVQRFIPLPAGFQGVVRVSLEGGQNVELTGLRAVYLQSAPASGATLVSMGAIWRYLDTGVNLSNAWRAVPRSGANLVMLFRGVHSRRYVDRGVDRSIDWRSRPVHDGAEERA